MQIQLQDIQLWLGIQMSNTLNPRTLDVNSLCFGIPFESFWGVSLGIRWVCETGVCWGNSFAVRNIGGTTRHSQQTN